MGSLTGSQYSVAPADELPPDRCLEKIKQAHASDFKGFDLVLGAVTPNKFLEAGRDISKRYSPDELKRLK